jgi:hypothetical protein
MHPTGNPCHGRGHHAGNHATPSPKLISKKEGEKLMKDLSKSKNKDERAVYVFLKSLEKK